MVILTEVFVPLLSLSDDCQDTAPQ